MMTIPNSRRATTTGNLRVSDAERDEVARALSQHYADGRLDQSEFNERIELTMAAKTRADLGPLLADLPPLTAAGTGRGGRAQPDRSSRPGRLRPTIFIVAAVVLLSVAASAVIHPHIPWVVIGLVIFLVSRQRRRHLRRSLSRPDGGHPPFPGTIR
jgi:hypothetical protein